MLNKIDSLIKLIDDLKIQVILYQFGVPAIASHKVREYLGIANATHIVVPTNEPNKMYKVELSDCISYLEKNSKLTISYLNLPLKAALLDLGDELSQMKYLHKNATLEFLRHIRNGIAHGNKFNIQSLKRPASFNELTINTSLNNQKVMGDMHGEGFLSLSSAFQLIDAVKAEVIYFQNNAHNNKI
ncbi:hypothetical protein [Pseudoalteromonas sp. HF66]|uniref:hypothetical protein n=1 Tax=Pseudoalteromonas sp. HF66 TaxID=2721559 RepID=UPI00142F6E7F|nr:hypothetical protein [Pseudoalteromonas sp. HF66]NIZ06475.1 hypothetical protein [Pseudoalteromonas sp. HF66]